MDAVVVTDWLRTGTSIVESSDFINLLEARLLVAEGLDGIKFAGL